MLATLTTAVVSLSRKEIPRMNRGLITLWQKMFLYFRFSYYTMTPEREERLINVLKKRQGNITVVLENIFDPHNISAVMRTCDAVGVQEIYVLNTRIPRHKKWGAKSSSSAAKWLTIHQYTDAALCFMALRSKYSRILTTHLSTDAVSLYEVDFTERVALVFGNEHEGVSADIRVLADGNFIIPQVGIIKSLNISVACAVSLYEAFRQKSNAGQYEKQSLPEDQYKVLRTEWGFYDQPENNSPVL